MIQLFFIYGIYLLKKGNFIKLNKSNDNYKKQFEEEVINKALTVHLNQNQYDALVILVYNIGEKTKRRRRSGHLQ